MLNLKRIHQLSSSNMQQNDEIEDDPPPPSPPNSEPIDIHIEDEEEEREEAESNVTEEAEAGAQSHGCIVKKYFRRDANDKGLYYCLKCPGAKKVRGSNTSNLWHHLEKHHFPIYIKHHSRQKLKEGKKKNQKRTNTASTSSSTSSYNEVEHASENGPKKMKQATILQSFALSKKATESKLSELAMAVLENCEFASVRLFDSPHFKAILECACPAFSSFTSSEDVSNKYF
ncbi:uncharacterized protein LOC135937347 [Cloeon dipterum]|uniref:uncharacterized protein LOC135937347 n=1 Tax=Cloeon dipterum TaxID=197152 RepID=UPI00321F77EE